MGVYKGYFLFIWLGDMGDSFIVLKCKMPFFIVFDIFY